MVIAGGLPLLRGPTRGRDEKPGAEHARKHRKHRENPGGQDDRPFPSLHFWRLLDPRSGLTCRKYGT
ncbi:MAG TPA: hypothetical protein VFQ44_06340 [Streptosporangiaceae bacterium]|nr:hypothetical protein [Streptosporangiaceae bacterium]